MKVLIFGATGSIGLQTIEVIKKIKKLKLVGISFYSNVTIAKNIINDFKEIKVFSLKEKMFNNVNSYEELIVNSKPDIIINAISGFAGLEITLLSLKNEIKLGLANKESIVVAGKFLINQFKEKNIPIIPIDSELTSIFSIYKNNENIEKIILTASGGKYFNSTEKELLNVKFKDVIKHPKWNMGEKISIDSSTMINKYFEMISAFYFFRKKIDVIQHPEAIIHSMIEKVDGSINLYASIPDMKISIQNVLNDFQSEESIIRKLDLSKTSINFNKIDEEKWLPIKWAKDFFNNQKFNQPIIINAANDALFELFKNDKIKYVEIIKIINKSLNNFTNYNINNIKDVYDLNDLVYKWIKEKKYE